MDGPSLKSIKDQIKETDVDIVEAFTPPPMGNLSLKEAREAWGDKFIIWVNFPETVFYYEPQELRKHVIRFLRETAPGDRVVMGITEDMPPDLMEEGLRTFTKTNKRYGKYPVSSF
jgi:hypothetical protein